MNIERSRCLKCWPAVCHCDREKLDEVHRMRMWLTALFKEFGWEVDQSDVNTIVIRRKHAEE